MSRSSPILFSLARPRAICRTCQAVIQRSNSTNVSPSFHAPESTELEQLLQQNYRPATTWDGLEWIGTKKWILKGKKKAYFDKLKEAKLDQKPFTSANLPPSEIERQLRNALVEVLLCKQMSGTLETLDNLPQETLQDALKAVTDLATISRISNGKEELRPVILCETPETRDSLLQAFANELETKAEASQLVQVESEAHKNSLQGWKAMPIPSDIRFALFKRILLRTGHRIPDCDIDLCSTAGVIHRCLLKPRKPPKLAEIIKRENMLSLPNVQTFSHRQNAINKDISVGRWKLIRYELEKRSLPQFKHKVIRERDLPTDRKQAKL